MEETYKKMYSEVLKKFPHISEGEIKLKFEPSTKDIIGISILEDDMLNPEIYMFKYFSNLTEDEKKAVIAHEIGHYYHYVKKHYNIKRTQRLTKFFEEAAFYNAHQRISKILGFISKKQKHKIKRLQKWYILQEIYADNKAAEVGYGEHVLSAIKDLVNDGYEPVYKEEFQARVKNLEEKLR